MKFTSTFFTGISSTMYLFLALVVALSFTSCSDDGGGFSDMKVYDLVKKNDIGGNGTATFEKISDSETRITISLDNDQSGQASPTHIHNNSALETGSIYITLEPVINGEAETIVTEADNGTPVTYEDLLDFDGYINVHESDNNLDTLLAQGDIGSNELTGEEKEYRLEARNDSDVEGTLTFQERRSGEAIAVFDLDGTTHGVMHPAHIHENSFAQGGGIFLTFNPVDGSTGMSETHIAKADDGSSFVYEDIEPIDGYVNVHLSDADLTVISQADIGVNELTGGSETYDLDELDGSGITGKVIFRERMDGSTLVEVEVNGGPGGVTHPVNIHEGNVDDAPGDIILTLTPVLGAVGNSYTDVTELDDGASMDYDDLKNLDGYGNVLLSENDETIVAQGNVGRNN